MRQYRNADLDQTKEFKDTLKEAHDYATTLPGGELSVEEQEEVIQMLEQLKERKKCVFHFLTRSPTHAGGTYRRQLAEFAEKVGGISSSQANLKMEVDSTASTPA